MTPCIGKIGTQSNNVMMSVYAVTFKYPVDIHGEQRGTKCRFVRRRRADDADLHHMDTAAECDRGDQELRPRAKPESLNLQAFGPAF